MFGFSMPSLIVILLIVLVIFGAGRLPELGSALGKSIRNFKSATDENDELAQAKSQGEDAKKS